MKCVQFESVGEPADVLQTVERDVSAPKHGEVRVRMLASPLNPSDLMFVRGTYGVTPALPQIPGFEGVGVVEESGGGLRGKLFMGKRVAVLNKSGGNWAEYAIVPADQVIPLSKSLSLEQAATFFVNPATAWIMTQEVLQVPPGAWLLQTAAGSSLGHMIIRLGKTLGFRTLNVVRNPDQASELEAAGATAVVVFDAARGSKEDFRAAVRKVLGDDPLQYAIDPVGGDTGSAVLQCLSHSARMLVFGTLSEQPIQISPRTLMTNNVKVEGFWLGNFMESKGLLFKLKLVRRITQLINDGVLASEIADRFSLDQVREAVQAVERPNRAGKSLIVMAPSSS